MKITYNEKKKKRFEELKPSDVFFCDCDMFIVTENIEDTYGYYYNAVNLSTGEHIAFEDGNIIELVDYEFKVNK